jgi:hypothetical protein
VASNPFPSLDKNKEANGSDLDLDTPETCNHYQCGRNGDHLMGVPFECDLCSFHKMTGKDPMLGIHNDHFTLVAIWRVLLDVMWAREPNTVAGNNWARSRRDYLTAVNHLSLWTESLLPVLGNPTVSDRLGMRVAILTVVTSLRAGINSSNIQYDTMQKTQMWYGNAFDAGREYTCDTLVGLDQKKQYLSSSHTCRKWFGHFMKGARLRMGMIRRQNEALTSAMILAICISGKGLEVHAEHVAENQGRRCCLLYASWFRDRPQRHGSAPGTPGRLTDLLDGDQGGEAQIHDDHPEGEVQRGGG